jgi:glycine dehydrogenase subunit 1
MPYLPHTDRDIKEMLARIGVPNVEGLWKAIPEKIRLRRPLHLAPGQPEAELMAAEKALAGMNSDAGRLTCLLGGGTYFHYIPPAIDALTSRSEFYTAYTPYQPEISQGTLQAIFEFQTMVCELTGMPVANASMYDGAEALAEAVLMALRIRPKNKDGAIVLARAINPLYRRAVKTYLAHSGRKIVEIGFCPDGSLDLAALKAAAQGALCVAVQHPNYFGVLEPVADAAAVCKETGAVLISTFTEALALGLLQPPGALGADLCVGEGQSLGIPMGFGGPHLGLFCCGEDEMRKMPGRLVGETVDHEGRRGFVLTLATREQHIRRAKATSNICTNQGLMSLTAAIYLTLIGPQGLREIAEVNHARTEALKDALASAGAGRPAFSGPTFNEFAQDLGRDPAPVVKALVKDGYLAGIPLGPDYPELKNAMLLTATEMVPAEALAPFARALARAAKEA